MDGKPVRIVTVSVCGTCKSEQARESEERHVWCTTVRKAQGGRAVSASTPDQRELDAKYSELQAKLDQIERQAENPAGQPCPECGELRSRHNADCAFAEFFEEPVRR